MRPRRPSRRPCRTRSAGCSSSPSDFPAGWTADGSSGADTATGSPACITDLDDLQGSQARVGTLYKSSDDSVEAVEHVGTLPVGRGVASVASLRSVLLACNGTDDDAGGAMVHLAVAPLDLPTFGDASFGGQITTTAESEAGSEVIYLNVVYVVKGQHALSLFWESTSPDTTDFRAVAAKAAARL